MLDKVSHGLETQRRYLLHTGLNVRVHAPLKTGSCSVENGASYGVLRTTCLNYCLSNRKICWK